jgi:pSer/pThr/pTyr-binding forkhead associated (FHA) protein
MPVRADSHPFHSIRKGQAVSAPPIPGAAKAKLSVVKGLRAGKTYGLKEGVTYIGRKGPQAVDVDLTDQENPGVAVQVNRFALVWFDKNGIGIADTGTRIGTTVNGVKIPKGKRVPLKAEDTLQFGKTILKVQVIKKQKTGVQK